MLEYLDVLVVGQAYDETTSYVALSRPHLSVWAWKLANCRRMCLILPERQLNAQLALHLLQMLNIDE